MPLKAVLRLLDRYRMRDLIHFGIISGAGLALDFAVFLLALNFGAMPFWANLCGNLTGNIFAFFVSTHTLFDNNDKFLWHKFIIYLAYNGVMMLLLSATTQYLMQSGWHPVVAKAMLLPISFYCSYLFMRWLITGKFSWR